MRSTHLRRAAFAGLSLSTALLAACQPGTAAAPSLSTPATPAAPAIDLVARGEYLVRVAGCNDCHTAGYAERQGQVPKEQWLTGSAPLGYSGPWGTTYATNLRLRMQELDEAQWLEYSANLHTRPIMPDFALRAMTEEDRRAIFRFIHGLGPAGSRAPDALPPGQTPPPPYLSLILPPAPEGASPMAAEQH
jgi:mono/diheme cytochrome c family protein